MFRVVVSCAVLTSRYQSEPTGLGGIGGIGGVFSPSGPQNTEETSETSLNIADSETQFGVGGVFGGFEVKKKSDKAAASPGFGGLGGFGNGLEIKVSKSPMPIGSLGEPKLLQPTQKSEPVENPCNSETNGNCEHYCREATRLEIDEVKGNGTLKLTSSLVFVNDAYAIVCYCAPGFTLRDDRFTCSNDEEKRLKQKLDELTYLSKDQDTWVVPVIIVCLIGALTILLMGGITYFCVKKTDKQREALAHSISTQSSTMYPHDPAMLHAALQQQMALGGYSNQSIKSVSKPGSSRS